MTLIFMKKPTQLEMKKFIIMTKQAKYNAEKKNEYWRLGRSILKYIAEQMELKDFDIRFIPGGIACSGDHILHNERFYLALHDNISAGWFYHRSCNGLQDYNGGKNQIVTWKSWVSSPIDQFIGELMKIYYPDSLRTKNNLILN